MCHTPTPTQTTYFGHLPPVAFLPHNARVSGLLFSVLRMCLWTYKTRIFWRLLQQIMATFPISNGHFLSVTINWKMEGGQGSKTVRESKRVSNTFGCIEPWILQRSWLWCFVVHDMPQAEDIAGKVVYIWVHQLYRWFIFEGVNMRLEPGAIRSVVLFIHFLFL